MHDRAPQITVHEERVTMTGYKFYCSLRANAFVNKGDWYYEAKITEMQEGGATRIGWAQRYVISKFSRQAAMTLSLRAFELIKKLFLDCRL